MATRPRVVVTGASGHIGYHVGRELCDTGFAVDLLVRRVNVNVVDLVRRGARHHIVELNASESYKDLLTEADCLFHTAAENTTEQDNPERVLAATAGLTTTILSAAAERKVKTVIYTSSVVVLGRSPEPQRLITEKDRTTVYESPYVRGKAEAEAICERSIREHGLDVRRLYPSWVVGPNDSRGTPPHQVVNGYLKKGQRFYFAGGISIAAVEQVAKAHVAAWLKGEPRGTYVLGGDNITFQEFFTLLAKLSGGAPPSIRLPRWFILAAASASSAGFKALGKAPPLDPKYAATVIGSYSWYDSTKAVRELDYKIPAAAESLAQAVQGERRRLANTYDLGKPRRVESLQRSNADELPPLLITGVPGWLGNRFIERLANGSAHGKQIPSRRVRLLVEPRHQDVLNAPENFEVMPADICDSEAIGRALDGVATVFHLAGAIYPKRISTLYKVNYEGTRTLVDACIKHGVRRILFMGTDSICSHGTSAQRIFDERTPDRPYRHYGRSKWLAERYVLDKTKEGLIDGTSLRGFWFFGPGEPERQRRFLNMMRQRRHLVFGNGKNFRSISHVDNIVTAFMQAETSAATHGKWYWIGDARPDYTVDEIYGALCAGCGNSYRPVHVPVLVCAMMRLLDAVMGKAGRMHPTIHGISKFAFDIAGTVDAARRDFGYQPEVSLMEYAKTAFR